MIRNLGALIAHAKELPRLKLTVEQQTCLDLIAELALSQKPVTKLTLAASLRWDVDRVVTVVRELETLGLVGNWAREL